MNTQLLNSSMDFENKISFLKTIYGFFPHLFNVNDFPAFIETIKSRYSRCESCRLCPETNTLYNKINFALLPPFQISIHTKDGYILEELSNIIYLEASDNNTIFHLNDGSKPMATNTLLYYEHTLPFPLFVRVHRSSIINIHQLSQYLHSTTAIMKDKTIVKVSAPYHDILRDILCNVS